MPDTTGVTSGARTTYFTIRIHELIPAFSGVRVVRSLVVCVMFCRSLTFCPLLVDHCIVCLTLSVFVFHCLSYIVCLSLSVLHCLSYIVCLCLSLSVFHCLSYIVCLSLSVLHCLSYISCLTLSVFHCLSYIVCLTLSVLHCLSFIVCLTLSVLHCLSFIVCLSLSVFHWLVGFDYLLFWYLQTYRNYGFFSMIPDVLFLLQGNWQVNFFLWLMRRSVWSSVNLYTEFSFYSNFRR
jgi:hypothetical protein